MNISLRNGTWYAGLERPFGANNALISRVLKGYGFKSVELFDRDETQLPAGIIPASDEWDTWGRAVYVGVPRNIAVNESITWVVAPETTTESSEPIPIPKTDDRIPTANKSNAVALLVAGIIILCLT